MTVMTPLAAAIDQASGSFSGELVQPDDAGYDVWRRVHNGLIDKRPAAIARCQGVADVVGAVDPAAVAYGPSLRRLQELKGKWDPDDLFRQNVNIVPRWDGGA